MFLLQKWSIDVEPNILYFLHFRVEIIAKIYHVNISKYLQRQEEIQIGIQ